MRLKEAAPALVGGGDHRLLHNLLLDFVSPLTIFFMLPGSSDGILPLLLGVVQPLLLFQVFWWELPLFLQRRPQIQGGT
jgi:hypothetical protein